MNLPIRGKSNSPRKTILTLQKKMTLTKKTRFAIFERDNFSCQYCGRTPQDDGVILEADHAISRADGGTDDTENLVTSCFDCNRGKSKKSIAPKLNIKEQLAITKEQLSQVQAMTKLISKKRKLEKEKFAWVDEAIDGYTKAFVSGMKSAVKGAAARGATQTEIVSSVDIALEKFEQKDEFYTNDFIKYFYGIIRNKLKASDTNS